jgi:allantoate deiminase
MSGLPAVVAQQLSKAEQILSRCDELAQYSSMSGGICRVYLSESHRQANERVGRWMDEAGMTRWTDAAGSLCGRSSGVNPDAPVVVIGSHLDSIPDAGRYDGVLGVLLGIAVIESLASSGNALPFGLEVVGFGEEEGVRFGTTLMASRAFAGTWDSNWWDLVDADGVTLDAAFTRFGLTPSAVDEASRGSESQMHPRVLAYLEAHIEQGPVLESLGLPLGVVTAIAGARRFKVRIKGMAGHAGTTPMNLRRDALVAAAHAVVLIEELAVLRGLVATVGQLNCEPGAVNVIPGSVEFSVDIRSADDLLRDAVVLEIETSLTGLCVKRNLELKIDPTHRASAVQCAPRLQQAMSASLQQLGCEAHKLASGAGHDAMAVADVCDVGMLFIRCTGGISHHPAEAVTQVDVAWALAALQLTIENIASEL